MEPSSLLPPPTGWLPVNDPERLDPQVRKAVVMMADGIAAAPATDLSHHLTTLGFPPPGAALPTGWRSFSPVRKIETYYRAARSASGKEGGERALAMLSRSLSLDGHPALLTEPAILPFLAYVDDTPLKFASPATLRPRTPSDSAVRGAIVTLAKYISSGTAPSIVHVLDHLRVPESDMYRLLRSSASESDILLHVVSHASDPIAATHKLVRFFEVNAPAVVQNRAVEAFGEKYGAPPEHTVVLKWEFRRDPPRPDKPWTWPLSVLAPPPTARPTP